MRRIVALAAIAGSALAFVPLSTPASACDPNRPPYCQSVCTIAPPAYYKVYQATGGYDGPLPRWSELGLPVCQG